MSKFHSRDGLYFERNADGAVVVTVESPGTVFLDSDTWASVVASMSERGETAETWQEARAFHWANHPAPLDAPRALRHLIRRLGGQMVRGLTRYDDERGCRVVEFTAEFPGTTGYEWLPWSGDVQEAGQ